MKQYSYNNKIYTVINCTLEDIPSQYERVLSYWKSTNTDINQQIELLQNAVKANTAFKIVDNNDSIKAFIYILLDPHRIMKVGQSNLLWFEDKRMLAMLMFYIREHERIFKLQFIPHIQKGIDPIPFKFLVNNSSIRLYHSHNTPLEIDLYSNKNNLLYELHFKKYNIKEL